MSKHTPGPWGVIDSGSANVVFSGSEGNMIAQLLNRGASPSERKANALLIAAAPDLLEALQAYEAWAHKTLCYDRELRPIRAQIRAAIAKATGEKQ